jgi:hypothetical protein
MQLKFRTLNRGTAQRLVALQQVCTEFRQCARDVLSSEQILLAARYLYQLDTLPDLRRLLEALSLAPLSPSPALLFLRR